MYTRELDEIEREWASEGLMTARQLLPLMGPVSTWQNWKDEERRTLTYLMTATARASESAFLLCAYGQFWDAEVLTRSALEGTLKFCYLLQSPATFPTRHQEYAHDLFQIGRSKDHIKAAEVLASVPDPDAAEWLPIREMLLSDEELADIRTRYDKTTRSRLEARWGFTGLIGELSRSGDSLFRGFGAAAHGYSIASHVAHVDYAGASIPMDRDMRSSERKETIHLAHEGRLISDLLIYLLWRLTIGYRFVGADMEPVTGAWSTIQALSEKFKKAYGEWLDVEYSAKNI
jgi:hypothetical protein